MSSFNKVLLMGNLTRDPEIRTTPSGLTIAKLGLAVNRRFRTKEGEQREETTFVDIDAFGVQADLIQRYCGKGSPLFVEGRLRLDQWQDAKTGENRSKLGVVLENFQFIGGRGGDAQEGAANRGESEHVPPRRDSAPAGGTADNASDVEEDDDVPF